MKLLYILGSGIALVGCAIFLAVKKGDYKEGPHVGGCSYPEQIQGNASFV
ncbi:MAG: hypothetical protein WC447_03190 [Candidatus Paceibacterota bacterium]|jgi:hypothetical protein